MDIAGLGIDMLIMDARLEPGFYWFLAYVIFSIAAGALMVDAPGRFPAGGFQTQQRNR